MTALDAQAHLDALARDVASPLPLGLLEVARGARRRRVRGRLAVVGAAAAVAVVALAVTLPGGATPVPPAPPASGPGAATGPVAPEGTRWVSQAGWMVAVPDTWERTETFCSAVRDEGPGFYYLEVDHKQCLPPEASASVGLLARADDSSLRSTALLCDPECYGTVAVDGAAAVLKKLPSAALGDSITDTLQPVPDGWLVDPTTGLAGPGPSVEGSTPLTDAAEVTGEWRVVGIAAGSIPKRVEVDLTVRAEPDGLSMSFPLVCNTAFTTFELGEQGAVDGVGPFITKRGCPSDDRLLPAGFGVAYATSIRVSSDSELMLVGPDDTVLAVYARA